MTTATFDVTGWLGRASNTASSAPGLLENINSALSYAHNALKPRPPLTRTHTEPFISTSEELVDELTFVAVDCIPVILDGYELTEMFQAIASIERRTSYCEDARTANPLSDIREDFGRWAMLGANWDGEGGALPIKDSIDQTVAFVNLMTSGYPVPEPMLHSTGRAGLYWNERNLYADLEFTGKDSITYYIKRAGIPYKGITPFNGVEMPGIFTELLLF